MRMNQFSLGLETDSQFRLTSKEFPSLTHRNQSVSRIEMFSPYKFLPHKKKAVHFLFLFLFFFPPRFMGSARMDQCALVNEMFQKLFFSSWEGINFISFCHRTKERRNFRIPTFSEGKGKDEEEGKGLRKWTSKGARSPVPLCFLPVLHYCLRCSALIWAPGKLLIFHSQVNTRWWWECVRVEKVGTWARILWNAATSFSNQSNY